MAAMAAILQIYFERLILNGKASWLDFWTSPPEWKGQLTRNIVGSIEKLMDSILFNILKVL